jgi:hypothetical protein
MTIDEVIDIGVELRILEKNTDPDRLGNEEYQESLNKAELRITEDLLIAPDDQVSDLKKILDGIKLTNLFLKYSSPVEFNELISELTLYNSFVEAGTKVPDRLRKIGAMAAQLYEKYPVELFSNYPDIIGGVIRHENLNDQP